MNPSHRLYSSSQMRAREENAVKSGISLAALMENAGRVAADEIMRRYAPKSTAILCGPGNNGGDGYVVARYLIQNGWPVQVFGTPGSELAKNMASQVGQISPLEKFEIGERELIIDALFGTGLDRPLDGIFEEVISKINGAEFPIIALDIPSGINSDTGEAMGLCVNATLTIAFDVLKPGHLLYPGKAACGHVITKDIGIPEAHVAGTKYFQNHPDLWKGLLKIPTWRDHKFTRGSVLVIGSGHMVGASRMSALSARRAGAGYVTLMLPSDVANYVLGALLGEIIQPYESLKDLNDALFSQRYDAVVLGPGMPADSQTQEIVELALQSKLPLVLDGGALSAYENDPEQLLKNLHGNVVLTPHSGEFQKLFHLDDGPRINLAQRAASQIKGTLVLKGADTIIARDDEIIIQPFASPWLSTAGSGDVLAGMIGAFLSQGIDAHESAAAGVWIHSVSADIAGPYLIAEDLIQAIPQALRSL